jgi:hypothetical protein
MRDNGTGRRSLAFSIFSDLLVIFLLAYRSLVKIEMLWLIFDSPMCALQKGRPVCCSG